MLSENSFEDGFNHLIFVGVEGDAFDEVVTKWHKVNSFALKAF